MKRNLLHSSLLTMGLALSATGVNAQQNYNQTPQFLKANSVWAMYNGIKIDMNTGTISYPSVSMGGDEGMASVADPNTGALLFYSDGGKVWNHNDAVMPNGSGLLGNSYQNAYSTTQGVCIVPMPGDAQKYYLFSLETTILLDNPASINLYYSIIDMSLDNGQGDIVASSKNTLLDGNTLLSESMVAIQGNNCDVWLLLHTRETPVFKAYHITSAGIDPTPVLSTTGGQIQGTNTISFAGLTVPEKAYAQSSIAVSPDRTKIAVSCQSLGGLEVFPILSTTGRGYGGLLCDFDAATGQVSNAMLIDTLNQYAAAFSPDGTKLYYTTTVADANLNFYSQVNQSDISSNDSASIAGSVTTLLANPLNTLVSLRAYNDTIYVNHISNLSFDRINSPNLAGTACNYQSNAIPFAGANQMGYTFPNEVVGAAAPDTVKSVVLDTAICSRWSEGIILHPFDESLSDSYTWNNGTTGNTLSVTVAGTYWVQYGNECHSRVDTFVLSGSDLNPVITANGLLLSTASTFTTYQWFRNNEPIAGATTSSFEATANGDYTVVVGNGTCTDTSDIYTVTNGTAIGPVQALARQVKVFPNPARDVVNIQSPVPVNVALMSIEGRVLKQVSNAKQIVIAGLASGIYILRITDLHNATLKMEKLTKGQ